MTDKTRPAFPVLAHQVKQYLADLGVEVAVDFERNQLYVVSIAAVPLGLALPRREGGLYLEPGDVVFI